MVLLQKFDVILTFWTASADTRVETSQRTHNHVAICAENDVVAAISEFLGCPPWDGHAKEFMWLKMQLPSLNVPIEV